jgi:hypothetical protein
MKLIILELKSKVLFFNRKLRKELNENSTKHLIPKLNQRHNVFIFVLENAYVVGEGERSSKER